jgi:hypothetical protein
VDGDVSGISGSSSCNGYADDAAARKEFREIFGINSFRVFCPTLSGLINQTIGKPK